MTAPAAASASPGRLVAQGARGVRAGATAPPCGALAPRQQLAAGAHEAGGQQHHAHDRAREHDEPGGHAGATDERDAGDQQPGDRDEHDAGRGERGMPRGGVGALSGLERAVTGAQLLLLTGGEQQCIVDAGAEPEHAAQRRREPGHVGRGGGPHQGAEAEPDAGEGRAEGVARGAQVAQHGDQQEDGDGEADHLADREPAGGGSVDRLAGHGDVDAGSLEAGGGVLEPVASRRCRDRSRSGRS